MFGLPFMKGGGFSLRHPKILWSGHKGQSENGPPGLRDNFIRGTVEDLSSASTDHRPGHSLRLVWISLGNSRKQ